MNRSIKGCLWPTQYPLAHRPYSRQVTERMEYNVIHPPPSVYPKAGNSRRPVSDKISLSKRQSYNRIHRARFGHLKLWHIRKHPTRMQVAQITVNLCFCNLHFFLFLRHSLHWIKLPVNYGVAANIGPLTNWRGVTVSIVIPTGVWVNRIVRIMTI